MQPGTCAGIQSSDPALAASHAPFNGKRCRFVPAAVALRGNSVEPRQSEAVATAELARNWRRVNELAGGFMPVFFASGYSLGNQARLSLVTGAKNAGAACQRAFW